MAVLHIRINLPANILKAQQALLSGKLLVPEKLQRMINDLAGFKVNEALQKNDLQSINIDL